MKRRIVYVLSASVVSVLMVTAPAFAHQAGPCTPSEEDSGHSSEFAKHHIVPFAQAGALGEGGHKPGTHRGFSACNPSGGQTLGTKGMLTGRRPGGPWPLHCLNRSFIVR